MAEYSPELEESPEIDDFEDEIEVAPEEMDDEEFGSYVARLLEDSIQYCDELSTDRVTSSKYYSG